MFRTKPTSQTEFLQFAQKSLVMTKRNRSLEQTLQNSLTKGPMKQWREHHLLGHKIGSEATSTSERLTERYHELGVPFAALIASKEITMKTK